MSAVALLITPLLSDGVQAQPTCFTLYDLKNPCHAGNADLIFIGRVVLLKQIVEQGNSITEKDVDSVVGFVRAKADISVETFLKGDAPDQLQVKMSYGCHGSIENGKRYVFKVRHNNDELYSNAWSEDLDRLSLQEAMRSVEMIRSVVSGKTQPRIFGRFFYRYEAHLTSRLIPLANIQIVVEKDGQKFTTQTRSDGSYEFPQLADGSYEIHPLLPPHLRPPDGPYDQPREQYDDKAEVSNRTPCGTRTDFVAWDNGVIAGHVEDADGNPVEPVTLEIWLLGEKGVRRSIFYPAQEVRGPGKGEFRFFNLPPGPYGFEVWFQERPLAPYHYLYYPGGVDNKDKVQVINLKPGENCGYHIKLPRLSP